VEDWSQSYYGGGGLSRRVVGSTEFLLRVLACLRMRATFFVLGEVARGCPDLVRRISREGHEIGSHGECHVRLEALPPAVLVRQLRGARERLEDVTGARVRAFRAPCFSVGDRNMQALDAVARAGFEIDSSIFPMRMPWYGVAGWPLEPRGIRTPAGLPLLEAPVAVATVGPLRVPAAGGGYLRLLPACILLPLLHSVLRRGRPAILYCHPYDFNPWEFWELGARVAARTRLTQGLGRAALPRRLRALRRAFAFRTLGEALGSWERLVSGLVGAIGEQAECASC